MRADVAHGSLVVDHFEEASPQANADPEPPGFDAMAPAEVQTPAASAAAAAAAPTDTVAAGTNEGTELGSMFESRHFAAGSAEIPDSSLAPGETGRQVISLDAGVEVVPRIEAAPAVTIVELPPPLSQRLRAAREAKGLSREEMARRMRVSPSVIQDIENDQWQRLGAAVYVRGHLTSYARSLGVPTVVVANALKDVEAPVPLALTVAAPPSSAWRRHLSAATYVVLTLLLAIPVFNLVPKRGVNSPVPQVEIRGMEENEIVAKPVDVPLPASAAAATDQFVGPPSNLAAPPVSGQVLSRRDSPAPLMASMTPMAGASFSAGVGQHRIEMTFSEDSWLEVLDAAGTRIDYGMARAGERRVHMSRGPVSMIVGNANGAQLRVDGELVDLGAFARLNVARLRLFESEPTSAAPSR